ELQGQRAEALAEELAGARQAVHRLEAQSEDFQSRLQSQMQEMERMRADTQECLRENDACARERALLSQRLQEVEAGLGDVRSQLREHSIEIEKLKALRVSTTKPSKAPQNPKALTNTWKGVYANVDDDVDDDDDAVADPSRSGVEHTDSESQLFHSSQQTCKSSES
ncbi:ftsH, partial [Symbiodinium sp. KB8]